MKAAMKSLPTFVSVATTGGSPPSLTVSRRSSRCRGKLAEPGVSDGPFATVERAREAVRALRKTQKEPRSVRVVLRSGTYYLNQPLEFGTVDSGVAGAPVVYAAARLPGDEDRLPAVGLLRGRPAPGGVEIETNLILCRTL